MARSSIALFNGKAKDMDTSPFRDPAVREAMRDLNKTFRRMNTKLEIASLRIAGKSPFSIHPEVEERMERNQ